MKQRKNERGAVSIFLVIILVPMLTVSALFVDASKLKLAKGLADSAADLTVNTALTDYDKKLKDMYGLFATSQDTEELYGKLEDYYKTCITSSGVDDGTADDIVSQIMSQLGSVERSSSVDDILNMELVDFDVSKVSNASLNNAALLEKQIVDFMKYRSPINTGLSFISSLKSFTTLSKQSELVEKRQDYYEAQGEVMKDAQEAWKKINDYNRSGDMVNDDAYFSNLKNDFAGFEAVYYSLAKKFIMDLYDTQNYSSFTYFAYHVGSEEVEMPDGQKKTVPVFYKNSAETSKLTLFTERSTYSDTNKASASKIKTALKNYYNAYKSYKNCESALLDYDNGTYGLQYLVQTNRKNLYTNWMYAAEKLYNRYSELRHAATYAEDGAMETVENLFGTGEKSYSQFYDEFMNNYDPMAQTFNQKASAYSSKLQTYANSADTSIDATANAIADIYSKANGRRTVISDAKNALDGAITRLNSVLQGVKKGGTLDQKEQSWKNTANNSEIADTSMAKQDIAELESVSSYLNKEDVKKLITRLTNIRDKLNELLEQMDSYKFFGTKICEINDYNTFQYILVNAIGSDNLKSVPINKSQLEQKASEWTNGKFTIDKQVETAWTNDSGYQPNLTKDQPGFYAYLYTHFNTGSVSTNTEEKTEDISNGKDLYNQFISTAESDTKNTAGEDKQNISNGNELKDISDKPSVSSTGSPAGGEVKTGKNAAKDNKASLSSMFSGLGEKIKNVGTDLRDKLFVADYIISMFSYDTIENEAKQKNGQADGETVELKTLTNEPINAENNYAYGKEVEYVIYGGDNKGNVGKAYGSIYAIRLGFNMIYAFSDSSIRDTAFAIATPISAATMGVIPAPLIQAAIIMGVACCESALDLVDLRDGISIPLFKNNKTWKTSIKGLTQKVKAEIGSALKDVANTAVDSGIEELNELLDMTDEELNQKIQEGVDTIEGSVGSAFDTLISRHANTAIQKVTTLCNNAIEEKMLDPTINTVQYVSTRLDEWLNQEKAVDGESSLSFIVKREAVNLIKGQYITLLIEKLEQISNNAQNSVSACANEIQDVINGIRNRISLAIIRGSDTVIQYKNKMLDSVKNSMSEGATQLKNTLNNQIDGIFGSGSGADRDTTGVASLLSFTYSDYLRLFLLIGLYTSESAVVLRTADAIQANMALKNDGFKMSNASVYVKLDATVQVKPTLLALPLFSDVKGNPASNQAWYSFTESMIKGY